MKFFHHLLNKHSTSDSFPKVQGYEDLKGIVSALDADENYNLLLVGPPASSKTLFLMGILDIRKDSVYFDGSNTTSRILDVLEEKRSKIICIDELDNHIYTTLRLSHELLLALPTKVTGVIILSLSYDTTTSCEHSPCYWNNGVPLIYQPK